MNHKRNNRSDYQKEEGEIEEVVFNMQPVKNFEEEKERESITQEIVEQSSILYEDDKDRIEEKADLLKQEMIRTLQQQQMNQSNKIDVVPKIHRIEFPLILPDASSYPLFTDFFVPKQSIYSNTPRIQYADTKEKNVPLYKWLKQKGQSINDYQLVHKKDYSSYYLKCRQSYSPDSVITLEFLLHQHSTPFIPCFSQSQFKESSIPQQLYARIPDNAFDVISRDSRLIRMGSKNQEDNYHTGLHELNEDIHNEEVLQLEQLRRERRQKKRKAQQQRKKQQKIIEKVLAVTDDNDNSSVQSESDDDQTLTNDVKKKRKLYRDVSHNWRTLERRLQGSKQEEGQLSTEETMNLFYKRNGIDLDELPPDDLQFIESLNNRHHEKWDHLVGKTEITTDYLANLKQEMMTMLNKEVTEESPTTVEQVATEQTEEITESKEEQQSIPSGTPQHDVEASPWQRAEKYRQLYKEMKTTRRRVVIPYQPSHSMIIHSYYPPNVYLKYHFVIDMNTTDVSPLPVIVPSSSTLKREEPSYESTSIEGYKPIKISRTRPSHDAEKKTGISSALQKEYHACCENEKVLQVKLHDAKDEISHLEKQIAETEKRLLSDQARHNSLVSNLHKRIETNALKKKDR